MKKIAILLVAILAFTSCKTEKKEVTEKVIEKLASVTPEMMESAVIYEANIRQYSPEGTFDAFTKDIPQLKELGVKVIWLMPIFPISETKRKATGGDFASKIEDPEERKKALGSYYAVSDFTKVNPEFGTIENFRKLLKTAHENGIYIILDWVPNHTGWDHTWLKTNPEFYTKNAEGKITDPLNEDGTSVGWADVADLNYDNKELHKTMIADMTYWITEEDIDGFRCDVAGSVPVDFWKEAISKLRAEKDIFMLAEAWEPELLHDGLFDMAYAWEGHHIMNEIAKSNKNANNWDEYISKIDTMYQKDDILLNFITNHDENSWNGTVTERMGDAAEMMLALSYLAPGMPLIYSGQEYDMNHRLKFFEKDSIPKTKGKTWTILEKLGKLKNNNVALNGGKNAASYERIDVQNKNILVFKRSKEQETVLFIANLSSSEQEFNNVLQGNFLNYMTTEKVNFNGSEPVKFAPWKYKILLEE